LSFGPEDSNSELDAAQLKDRPRKPVLNRLVVERSVARQLDGHGLRPSYSKDALLALQQSTPSPDALQLESKFGPLATLGPSISALIPTDAEIREKKERRARLAKEQEFISLHGDVEAQLQDSDDELQPRHVILRPDETERYTESRLVHEDEDIAEGFDDYVEDGRIALGKKSHREQQRKRQEEISTLIKEAQAGSSDTESNGSEAERQEAYDATQTRAGTYARKRNHHAQRPSTPPKITPIPSFTTVLSKLHNALDSMRKVKHFKEQRLSDITLDKIQIAEQEAYIQSQLKETGDKYEKLQADAGLSATTSTLEQNGKLMVHRGLDNLGPLKSEYSSEDEDYH